MEITLILEVGEGLINKQLSEVTVRANGGQRGIESTSLIIIFLGQYVFGSVGPFYLCSFW